MQPDKDKELFNQLWERASESGRQIVTVQSVFYIWKHKLASLTKRVWVNDKLIIDRRVTPEIHYIGDRRRSWFEKLEDFLGIEPPNTRRTWRINIVIAVGTIQVVLLTLATARVNPESFMLIPIFCFYFAGILAFRKYRLENMPL
jgi:hypothetical protein